jgi:hypothetical protein
MIAAGCMIAAVRSDCSDQLYFSARASSVHYEFTNGQSDNTLNLGTAQNALLTIQGKFTNALLKSWAFEVSEL